MLGGGGYTMRNVSRAWAYETGLATGMELGAGQCPLLMERDVPSELLYQRFQ